MALVNQAKREINAKIVYFGPGRAGKSTNLRHIYGKLKQEFRGSLKGMDLQNSRMLFFDFTPPGDGNVDGFRVRFHVYTVSGPQADPAAWKMVLKGVDGIVFVADCTADRQEANRESLDNLALFLKGHGLSLGAIPLVFQYNKSDLPEALPAAELERVLNPSRLPGFTACGLTGEGVLQTLLGLVKTVLGGMRGKGVEGISSAEGLQGMVEPAAAAPKPPAAKAPPAPQPSATLLPEPAVLEPQLPEVHGWLDQAPEEPVVQPPAEEPLLVEISGVPEAVGDELRVPLAVRSGERSRSFTLTISLSCADK